MSELKEESKRVISFACLIEADESQCQSDDSYVAFFMKQLKSDIENRAKFYQLNIVHCDWGYMDPDAKDNLH